MIRNFKHKGLEQFFRYGIKKGINNSHKEKLEQRLTTLHTAVVIEDIDIPGWGLHELKGKRKGISSIKVSGNWRITFKFKEGNVYIIDYEDYH